MKEPEENQKTTSISERLSTPPTPQSKREQVQAVIEAIEIRRKFIKPKIFREHPK
jgi:hypothetical protein